jgi:hypothetical protein
MEPQAGNWSWATRLAQLLNVPGITGTAKDYKDHTDPKYIGPGYWNIIHTMAYHANTIEKQRAFIEFLKFGCETYPCGICQEHWLQYMIDFDPAIYLGKTMLDEEGIPQQWGMFIWSWQFHNAVNQRVQPPKPQMEFITALDLFGGPPVCGPACTELEHSAQNLSVSAPKGPWNPLPKDLPSMNQAQIEEITRFLPTPKGSFSSRSSVGPIIGSGV